MASPRQPWKSKLRTALTAACCLTMIWIWAPLRGAQANQINATTISVNTATDELNADGDCSLREAVRAANLNSQVDACPAGSSGTDAIFLPAGTYNLSITNPTGDEDAAQTGDLDITGSLTIIGGTPLNTILDVNYIDRAFELIGGVTLKLTNLTVRRGLVRDVADGGAILVNPSSSLYLNRVALRNNEAEWLGGAVYIAEGGYAQINGSTLDANASTDIGMGGGIYNAGNLVVLNTTFSNNLTDSDVSTYGGGLYTYATATLINVTFSGNSADEGGGIFNDGITSILNGTITGNTIGIQNKASIEVKNTIIAGNLTANCAGYFKITTLGYNLDSGETCINAGNLAAGDLYNTDPMLGVLANNLGPTYTHALQAGSPAIDTGDAADCPAHDQRGALRPADGDADTVRRCDIGAYEYLAVFPMLSYLPLMVR